MILFQVIWPTVNPAALHLWPLLDEEAWSTTPTNNSGLERHEEPPVFMFWAAAQPLRWETAPVLFRDKGLAHNILPQCWSILTWLTSVLVHVLNRLSVYRLVNTLKWITAEPWKINNEAQTPWPLEWSLFGTTTFDNNEVTLENSDRFWMEWIEIYFFFLLFKTS